MLPKALLTWTTRGAEVVPGYLTPADHPWLRDLLETVAAQHERRVRDWDKAVVPSDGTRRASHRMAAHLLRSRCRARPPSASLDPRGVRAAVFPAARDRGEPTERVIARVADALQVTRDALVEALFADLRGGRTLLVPTDLPGPEQLALEVNLALVQGLLAQASRVTVELDHNARALVRQVQLRRLLCVVRPDERGLEISGPYELFRRTTLYGRRLASLVPVLSWCGSFRAVATVHLDGRELTLRLDHRDPLPPGREPTRFDSKVEERFARDLARLASDRWDIRREPEPVPTGDALMFPDFAVRHRLDPGRYWLVEIVGFWTPTYLERKLDQLRRCGRQDVILCVDRDACGDDACLPADLPVVWFRRTIDATEVLSLIEATHETIGVRDLFIDHAGRQPAGHPIHAALRASLGRRVDLESRGHRVAVVYDGVVIAWLSARAADRWRERIGSCSASVIRLERRRATASGAGYRHLLRIAEWDLPILMARIREP